MPEQPWENEFESFDRWHPETAEVLDDLLRALRRKKGFGLFFVQCNPAQGTRVLNAIRKRFPQKRLVEFELNRQSETLYGELLARYQRERFEIAYVTGVEQALYAYEDTKRLAGWSSEEIYNYSWKGLPPLLGHLNRQREAFEANLPIALIFLVPSFAIDYFVQRAPDFFDWRSGFFKLSESQEDLQKACQELVGKEYEEYLKLTSEERIEKILEIKDKILQLESSDDEYKSDLLREQGLLFESDGDSVRALDCFDRAITVNYKSYSSWNSKGQLLYDLGRYEEAIESYDQALAIKPNYYYTWDNRGDALCSLERYEEAIESYDRVIELKPNYYDAWINRGHTVGQLQASILMPSLLAIQNPQLNKPGYPGELATYEEGLKHCSGDTHPESWGRLHHAMGKAHYSRGRVDLRPQPYFRKARTHYLEALKTLTEKDFPELHLKVLQDLIRVSRELRFTEQAEEFRRRGAALLQRLLADTHRSDLQKQKLALKSAAFNQLTVDTLIRQGSLIQAMEVAEAGKNACLRWLLYSFEYEPESPDFAQMRDWVQPGTALVSWHLSPVALTAFVLLPGGVLAVFPETEEELDSLRRVQQLEDWIARWNRDYGKYRGDKDKQENAEKSPGKTDLPWRGEMDNRLAELAQLLYISEICQHLSSLKNSDHAIQNLILVPHRDLHRLPLPALFTLANIGNIDINPSQNLAITTLPSIKMGLNLSPREIAPTSELLAIAHPNSFGFAPLPYTVLEVAAIRQFFPQGPSLAEANATASRVAQSLETASPLLHFAGHGTYNFSAPLAAYLALAGEDKLTLKQLLELPLGDIALVTLSTSETAITGNETIASEYVGLVSGFLSRGVPYVVSTLWVVESAASALLVAYFYRQLAKGKSPAIALMSAQSWLRRLSAGKLRRIYQVILAKLPEDDAMWAYLDTECDNLATMTANDLLYKSPYHWAAFTLTGL